MHTIISIEHITAAVYFVYVVLLAHSWISEGLSLIVKYALMHISFAKNNLQHSVVILLVSCLNRKYVVIFCEHSEI